ncbi:MAG: TolB protein [Actinomycetota bacterium]|jgi:Tol biopolymer transport system component|nr:TolB protein [Actinomycetota bacterium]
MRQHQRTFRSLYVAGALTITLGTAVAIAAPAWATFPGANGRILYSAPLSGVQTVFSINPNGTGVLALTSTHEAGNAEWSADGTKIVFDSYRKNHWSIFVMNANGTGVTRITSGGDDVAPTWSPDGTKIAYGSRLDGNIYVINANGTGKTQIASAGARNQSPDWSPDGTKIAFDSYRQKHNDIFVVNPDEPAAPS